MGTELAIISLVLSTANVIYASTLDLSDEPDDTGQNVTKEGVSATKNVIYGHTRTGAVKLYTNVNDHNSEQLLQTYSFGFGVTGIYNIFIDDVSVIGNDTISRRENAFDGNEQLLIPSSELINGFQNQVTLQLRAGLETGIPMSLAIDNSDGEWTTEFRGDDVSCMAILTRRIVEDGVRITSDNISVSALVDGVPVYDPRYHASPSDKDFSYDNGGMLVECGRNPSLCLLDYLTSTKYGLGLSYDYLDVDSFTEVANWCEANNFFIDGEVNSGNSFADNLTDIMNCAGLILTIENGALHCHYEDIVITPTQNFDHDNILDGTLNVQEVSSSTYYNLIECEYKNLALDDKQDTYTVPSPADTDPQIIADGEIHSSTLSLPLVRYDGDKVDDIGSPIKYLANRELRKSQFQRQVTFDIDLSEYPIQIFDTFTLTDENLGWVNKEYRVMSISKSINDDKGINIATINGTEYDDSIYTGSKNGGGGGKPLPKPPEVSPVTGLTFDQTDYITEGYGWLRWANTFFASDVAFIVDYKMSSSSTWERLGKVTEEQFQVARLPAGFYDFRVITVSTLYGSSIPAELTNQEIGGIGVLPPVTGCTADFTGVDCVFTWDDMLNEPISRTPDEVPRTVKDVFTHYRISLFDGLNNLLGVYNAPSNTHTYTLAENTTLERVVHGEVQIVAVDGSMSQIETTSEYTATNPQHPELTGLVADGSLSTITLRWNPTDQTDYRATLVRRKTGVSGSYVYFDVLDNTYTDTLPDADPDGTLYYYNVAAYDVFDQLNLNWSIEVSITKKTIDDYLPEFPDELGDIRDPERSQTTTGELIMNVASPDKETVTGWGLYAKDRSSGGDVDSGASRMIVAADEFVLATGGHANWDASVLYGSGDRVNWVVNDLQHSTYEALTSTIGQQPDVSPSQWRLLVPNNFQSAFYIDAASETLYIRNATIQNIDAGKITTGTLDADRIDANSITGDKINASTTIEVGTITNEKAFLSGLGDWRIWSGFDDATKAPFRVNQKGELFATLADITGAINATSGTFTGNIRVGNSTTTGNYVDILGSGTAGSNQRFLRVQDSGYERVRWDYDGRLMMSSGSKSVDPNVPTNNALYFDPVNNNFIFNGTVYAERLVGDIVTSIQKINPSVSRSGNGDSEFGRVIVSTGRPYIRTLIIQLMISAQAKSSGETPPARTMSARLRVNFNGVNYYSQTITSSKGSGSNDPNPNISLMTIAVSVPANFTGTAIAYLSAINCTGGSVSISAPSTNDIWTPQLFKDGGDLS